MEDRWLLHSELGAILRKELCFLAPQTIAIALAENIPDMQSCRSDPRNNESTHVNQCNKNKDIFFFPLLLHLLFLPF